jgi:hypothetical protein
MLAKKKGTRRINTISDGLSVFEAGWPFSWDFLVALHEVRFNHHAGDGEAGLF